MDDIKVGNVVICTTDIHKFLVRKNSIHIVTSVDNYHIGFVCQHLPDNIYGKAIREGRQPNWRKYGFKIIAPKATVAISALYGKG